MKDSTQLGMKTFDQSLFELYQAGEISYDDALRYADSQNEVRLRIKLAQSGDARTLAQGLDGVEVALDGEDVRRHQEEPATHRRRVGRGRVGVELAQDAGAEQRKRHTELLPGDAPAPTQFVFLANGNAPPPSAEDLARQEVDAQAREELNALYVGMTRARERLVLSGVTPHRQPATGWWQRISALPHSAIVSCPRRVARAFSVAPTPSSRSTKRLIQEGKASALITMLVSNALASGR